MAETAIRLTPARRMWLEHLRDQGPAERHHTNVGYYCMQAGWTEWNYFDRADGANITGAEGKARYGERFWDCLVRAAGERITEAGLAKLREDT